MIKSILKYGFYLLVFTVFLACQEKNKVVDKARIEDVSEVLDTLEARNEFTPISAKKIAAELKKMVKYKVVFSLPSDHLTDTLINLKKVEELAISVTHLAWARVFKSEKIEQALELRTITILNQLSNTSKVDSLPAEFLHLLSEDEQHYFEAICWLENLHLSLEKGSKSAADKKYLSLIMRQLNKGDELMNFLYEYQNYEPISSFSQEIVELIDCRNYQLNVTQLQEIVQEIRLKIIK